MSDSLPIVPRFNPWGTWHPLVARCPVEKYSRVMSETRRHFSHVVQAVNLYCEFSGNTGIEFVVISTGADGAPYRRYASGAILVPCRQPSDTLSTVRLYDGWLPLSNPEPETIAAGIQIVDEVVTLSAHVLGASARWIAKYVEGTAEPTRMAHITDAEHEVLGRTLMQLHTLPTVLQAGILRSIHWMQHSTTQLRPTDSLLPLWQALESLLLVIFEYASDLEIQLPNTPAGLSRKKRHELVRQHAARILAEEAERDPVTAVKRAYFEAITPIRGRCEAVLYALLGTSDERVRWLYDGGRAAWSPNAIRNQIVHDGKSAIEIEAQCNVPERVHKLRALVLEVILRILSRKFQGAPLASRTQTMSMPLINPITSILCIPEGDSPVITGDFTISFSLLLAKGLL